MNNILPVCFCFPREPVDHSQAVVLCLLIMNFTTSRNEAGWEVGLLRPAASISASVDRRAGPEGGAPPPSGPAEQVTGCPAEGATCAHRTRVTITRHLPMTAPFLSWCFLSGGLVIWWHGLNLLMMTPAFTQPSTDPDPPPPSPVRTPHHRFL